MKLTNINSSQLLPRFAAESKWLCDAFDELVKAVNTRAESLPAPLTIESIERLTDEELQAFYEQFGLVIYYPDISRDRRNWLLFQVYKYWVSLGTKMAVETLVQYIFDDVTVHIKVYDNLAYGVNGTIIHPELLDMFDVEVLPLSEGLPDNATARILANILMFSPNSQTLRDLWYTMPDNDIDVSCRIGAPEISSVVYIENYVVCEVLQPTILKGYTTSNGATNIQNTTIGYYQTAYVYNESGGYIQFNPGFTLIKVYYINNGVLVEHDTQIASNFRFIIDYGNVKIRNLNNSQKSIAEVEFKQLEAQKAYLSQYGHTSNYSLAYNTNTILYDETGNTIPYDTSKTYTLTCCSKADETITNEVVKPVNMSGSLGYICSNTGSACWIYYTVY